MTDDLTEECVFPSEVNSSQEIAEKAEIDEIIEEFKRIHAPRLHLPVNLPPQEATLQNPSYVPRRQRQRKSNQNSTQTFLTHSIAGVGTGTGTSPSSLSNESFLSLPQSSPSTSSSSSSSSSSSPAVTDLSLHPKPPHRSEISMARRIRAMHPLLRRRYLNRCAQVTAASGASHCSSSSSFSSSSSSSSLLRSS